MIWKCRDKEIDYSNKVSVMGIVNVTPDSFSDGGKFLSPENAYEQALLLAHYKADIIDIGAQSTRPGHTPVSQEEEWERLEPVIKAVRNKLPLPISVDTYYPYVAEKALESGADIINDVSGVINPGMADVVKRYSAGWIIMHNGKGSVNEVKSFFEESIKKCEDLGIDKDYICLDMGIGFGKDNAESMELIANVKEYKIDGYPLLLGTSRKRVIGQGSGQENPAERTYGNIAADAAAVLGGVNIIRLHDVKNERQGVLMAQNIRNAVV